MNDITIPQKYEAPTSLSNIDPVLLAGGTLVLDNWDDLSLWDQSSDSMSNWNPPTYSGGYGAGTIYNNQLHYIGFNPLLRYNTPISDNFVVECYINAQDDQSLYFQKWDTDNGLVGFFNAISITYFQVIFDKTGSWWSGLLPSNHIGFITRKDGKPIVPTYTNADDPYGDGSSVYDGGPETQKDQFNVYDLGPYTQGQIYRVIFARLSDNTMIAKVYDLDDVLIGQRSVVVEIPVSEELAFNLGIGNTDGYYGRTTFVTDVNDVEVVDILNATRVLQNPYVDPGFGVTYTDLDETSEQVITHLDDTNNWGVGAPLNIGTAVDTSLVNGIDFIDGSEYRIVIKKDDVPINPSLITSTDSSTWVDLTTAGTYTIEYTFTNDAGVSSTVVRTVTVVPNTVPVITLNGLSTMYVINGDTFVDPSVIIFDDEDISTGNLVISGSVNTSVDGDYVLSYTYTDASLWVSNTVTRTVTVFTNTGPIITLVGSDLTLASGDAYTELGYSAVDAVGRNITSSVIVDTSELTTINKTYDPITYTVYYRVVDSYGISAVATRDVIVESRYIFDDISIDNDINGSRSIESSSVMNVSLDTPTKRALYNKDLAMANNTEITDLDSLIQNMWNVLFTEPRERLFNPVFGSRISFRVFDLMSDETEQEVLDILSEDIQKFESRLEVVRGVNGSLVTLNPSNNSFTVLLVIRGQGIETKTVSFTKEQ